MNINFDLPKDATRIWDLAVPIITNGDTIHAYITDEIMEPSNYNELTYMLATASQYHKFILHINTPGGIIDSAFHLIDAIKSSDAHVTAYLTGTVASAGTIITLACDDVVVSDNTSWMSHNYSGGLQGKGHELKAWQEFTDKALNKSFREIHKGFFTDEEITQLIDGKDFWLGKEDILARWELKNKLPKTEES